MKAVHVHARIDADTKTKAENIIRALGLTPSQTVNLFYRQIIASQGIPFPLHLPNEATAATFKATDEGRDLYRFESASALLAAIKGNA
jgi:DNA-damage-inducible protein J